MRLSSMTRAVVILLSLLLASEAQAISRYDSRSLSCARIQAIVQSEGAAIMRWTQPPNIQRYDRFVANSSFCFAGETAVPASVPSADTGSCPVRVCKRCERDPDDFGGFFSRDCY